MDSVCQSANNLQAKLKQFAEHNHAIWFYHVVKFTLIFNVLISAIGGALWILVWSSANDATSAIDFYYKIQPISNMPEPTVTITSYIFIITIILNVTFAILFLAEFFTKVNPNQNNH